MADKQAKDWAKTIFNLDKFFSFIPPKGTSSFLDRSDKILNFWMNSSNKKNKMVSRKNKIYDTAKW